METQSAMPPPLEPPPHMPPVSSSALVHKELYKALIRAERAEAIVEQARRTREAFAHWRRMADRRTTEEARSLLAFLEREEAKLDLMLMDAK